MSRRRAIRRPGGSSRPSGWTGFEEVGHGARRLRSAVLQVVHRRHAERLLQLPRPPRRGGQGRARRVSLARRGRLRARHHLRGAAGRGQALRQRAEGPRREQGRRGGDLPADDPGGRRGDARLRADRRSAQRRLRRLLRGGRARADGVLAGARADHRRRRRAQGQDGAGEGPRGRGDGRSGDAREDRRRAEQGHALRDAGGTRRLLRGDLSGGRCGVRGRADGRGAPAVHPLHVGLDGQAEGHPAHDRRLPDGGRGDPPLHLRSEAGGGRVLVRGRRRLGDRALLHRLRAAGQRRDLGDVGGRAGLPEQGCLVGDRRALRRHDPVLRADRDQGLHQVGRGVAEQTRPVDVCACSGRSASRSTRRRGSGTTR